MLSVHSTHRSLREKPGTESRFCQFSIHLIIIRIYSYLRVVGWRVGVPCQDIVVGPKAVVEVRLRGRVGTCRGGRGRAGRHRRRNCVVPPSRGPAHEVGVVGAAVVGHGRVMRGVGGVAGRIGVDCNGV